MSTPTITLRLDEQTHQIAVDQQVFVSFGLRSIGLLSAAQCWHRLSGSKLPPEREYESFHWIELLRGKLLELGQADPAAIKAATRARASL